MHVSPGTRQGRVSTGCPPSAQGLGGVDAMPDKPDQHDREKKEKPGHRKVEKGKKMSDLRTHTTAISATFVI